MTEPSLQQIVWLEVEKITPYEDNAKKHPKKQLEQIADSIAEFGCNQPVVLDQQGVIIVGHGRFLAMATVLEWEKVPTITVNLDEEKAKAYRLADNKLNESDWDMELVINELKGLSLPMLDLTGFSRDLILKEDDNDDVVPTAPKVAQSQLGDVFVLPGGHVLVCGDSTDPEV